MRPTIDEGFELLVRRGIADGKKAMVRFPQPNYVITKFAEESGEVVKEVVHYVEGRGSRDAVLNEMLDVIAMMYRLWAEGDGVHKLEPLHEGGVTW